MGKRLKLFSYSANTFLIWTQQTLRLIALILYRLDLIAEVCARNCLYQNNESFMVHSESCYSDLAAFGGVLASIRTKGCYTYILDSSNSSSITFWTTQFGSSSRSNWTGIWTGNSNGSWTDKQSSHFSTVKEMSVKATFFFM